MCCDKMERQEKILFARQECMQNLSFGSNSRKSEQEKQERDLSMQQSSAKGMLGVRCIIAILFFLFLFGMKMGLYHIGTWDCDNISNMLRENSLANQIEETVEDVMSKSHTP